MYHETVNGGQAGSACNEGAPPKSMSMYDFVLRISATRGAKAQTNSKGATQLQGDFANWKLINALKDLCKHVLECDN